MPLERAHTLVEFMVALLILTLVIVCSIAGWKRSSSLRRVARETAAAIEQASQLAMIEGITVEAVLLDREIAVRGDGRISDRIPLPARVRATLVSSGAPDGEPSLACHPSGACSPGTIRLIEGRSACDVVVSLRGRVRWSCP